MTEHQTCDVFDEEVTGIQFSDDPREIEEELIPWVIRLAFANEGKTLAGRPTEYYVYFVALTQAG